jgi:hypothetical protein
MVPAATVFASDMMDASQHLVHQAVCVFLCFASARGNLLKADRVESRLRGSPLLVISEILGIATPRLCETPRMAVAARPGCWQHPPRMDGNTWNRVHRSCCARNSLMIYGVIECQFHNCLKCFQVPTSVRGCSPFAAISFHFLLDLADRSPGGFCGGLFSPRRHPPWKEEASFLSGSILRT